MKIFAQLPQAIVISGESGSGKTVNTSHIVDFLCSDVASLSSAPTSLLSRRLRHSGALFESLGNSCTLRNNNSRLSQPLVLSHLHR
jgi:myosin heavy subunit